MAAFTAFVAVAGLALNFIGQKKQQKALKQQSAAVTTNAKIQTEQQVKIVDNSKAQEEERKKALKVEADAKRRANVRQFLVERARSLSSAVNRGLGTQSSGTFGGASSATSQFASNQAFITKGERIGLNLFGLNQDAADIRGVANIAQTAFQAATAKNQGAVSSGQATSSFGTTLFANAQTIGNVGTSLFT